MAAPYCPRGNYYRYWPVFSISNMEYIGSGQTVYTNSIVANTSAIRSGSDAKIRPLTVTGTDMVGTHAEAQFTDVRVYRAGTLANNTRIIGVCLYNATMTSTLYGIWFGYNVYSGGNCWVWHGTGSSFTGLSPSNLSSGVHGINASMDFLSRSLSGSTWVHNIRFTLTFTTGAYSGTSYTAVANNINVGTNPAYIGIYYANGSYWHANNTSTLSHVFIWGPTVAGRKCGRIYDLMSIL